MTLNWGVTPILARQIKSTDEMIDYTEKLLVEKKLVKKGDTIVIVAGVPLGVKGGTNLLKMQIVR